MKNKLGCLILLVFSLCIYAEDGHNLWLRSKGTGSVNIVCDKGSSTLAIAKRELEQGWKGKDV